MLFLPQTPEVPVALEVPAGLAVSVWAESPALYNPTAIDIDHRGRVWLTEAVNYRAWGDRNPGRRHPDGERIVILEDTDGDGRADVSKVFAVDPELVAPLGIALVGDRVYVSCSPHLFVYIDDDGDDVADRRETVLTGFGGFDHDHGLHSVVPHLDGKLYVAVGNAGPHLVTGPDGRELRSGSLYRDGGSRSADNKPGLVSSDGRVWTGGLILRFDHDGSGLEVLAHNFRNPYEVAVSRAGDLFTADNDDDGNQACRVTWVLPGGNYGFFSADGSRTWQADRRPGQATVAAHWHQDDPGVAPLGTVTGAGGPTGVAVYEGDLLATWIGGHVLHCDAGARVVYAHRPTPAGVGLQLEPGVLVRAATGGGESADWFRPSDVCVGPAGEVYVADWYDPGVGGHAAGDRRAFGRILRIAPAGQPVGVPPLDLTTAEGIDRALRSPAVSVRERARAAAQSRATSAAPRPGLRLVEELRALAEAPFEGAARERLLTVAEEDYDGTDRWLLEALGAALELHAEVVYAELAATIGAQPLEWDQRFERLAWRLHPRAAVPAFLARALSVTLDESARRRAIDALAFTRVDAESRTAADALSVIATAGPEDLRAYALAWLQQRDAGEWRGYGVLAGTQRGARGSAEEVYTSGVLRRGSVDIDVDIAGATDIWLVVNDGGDGNSYDWAAWAEPRFVDRDGVEQPLRAWTAASADWGSVQLDRDPNGGTLELDGRGAVRGIGTHAASEVACPVPPSAVRFRATVGPERGGTEQAGGQGTSLGFQVFVRRAPQPKPLRGWLSTVLDPTATPEARLVAAEALAADSQGALLLLEAAEELSVELRAAVGAALFRHPDLAVRALSSERFPRPDGAEFPSIAALLQLEGDVRRGRELFEGRVGSAGCVACHAYRSGDTRIGADLGPELTVIRRKLGKDALFDAILNPSAGIAFGYDTYILRTTDGLLYSGFLLADGPTVALLTTSGERLAFDAAEIVERRKQTTSTMPEGVALGLSPVDLADIVAFLSHDPEDAREWGAEIALFDGQSLTGWSPFLADPSVSPDAVWSVRDGVLACVGHPAGYLRTQTNYTNFHLSLEWRFDPKRGAGNSGVLLRVIGDDQIWPRSIEAQLQSGNSGDFWNIEEFPMRTDPARTSGRHTARRAPSSERPLGEWNRYEISVMGPRVELVVNGVLQNMADWCAELPGAIALQSEGAYIEFRNIVLRQLR